MAPRYKPEPSPREAKEILLDEVIGRLSTDLTEEQRDELRATARPTTSCRRRRDTPAASLHGLATVYARTPRDLTGVVDAAARSAAARRLLAPTPPDHDTALSYVNEGRRRFRQIPAGTAQLVATPESITPAILDSARALKLST